VALTEKQKRFADYYIETGNATEAAGLAGYSERTAYSIGGENLRKPEIKNYIDERLKQLDAERIADATEVLKYLTEVIRGESETEEVFAGPAGVETVMKKPNERERLKAAELLGKRYGLYTDKVRLGGNVAVQIMDDMEGDNAADE